MKKSLDFIVENSAFLAAMGLILGLFILVVAWRTDVGAEDFDYQGHSYIQFNTGSVVHNPDCGACR